MRVPRSIFTFYLLTADGYIFRQVLYSVFKAKPKAEVEQDIKLCIHNAIIVPIG